MKSAITRLKIAWIFALVLTGILSGCGGKNDDAFVQPPMPRQASYKYTENYYYHYNQGVGRPPFLPVWQFSDVHYPIPISYQVLTVPPSGFDLAAETEQAIACWFQADPRVCIVSRTTPQMARVHVVLENDILAGQSQYIGLTSVLDENVPSFKVEIALRYNTTPDGTPTYEYLSAGEIKKTIAHELGHVFGLGHSPKEDDLMFWQANAQQGTRYDDFLTYGDAMAIWTTLNVRRISWQHLPAYTMAPGAPQIIQRSLGVRSTAPSGTVVDVYTKE